MILLDYYLWGAIKDKCYADKPDTIDALKDNIREAIGEIQLHTIDNVLENWTDRVGYCLASRGCHLNEIIFQPKLHPMFCTLFLKMALSIAELMSFGHLGAAI